MVSILSERRGKYAPFGLEGGGSGQLGKNTSIAADGSVTDLGGKNTASFKPGDRLRIESPGAGGYGAPLPQDERKDSVSKKSKVSGKDE